jgi:quercetin dioxygenase-like cupin family protein
MSEMTRREMGAAAAAFALMAGWTAEAQIPGAGLPDGDMSASTVFRFKEMVVKPNANGGWGRAVVHGKLPTGEFVEVHESMLPVGKMPHGPHRHNHSEFILMREGTVEYVTDHGRETAGPGDVIFTASNRPHGMRNVGDVAALYFVVAVGVQNTSIPVTMPGFPG